MLTAERAAGGDERLEPTRHRKGAVGKQAVIAKRDAHTTGEPIEHQKGADRLPTPEPRQQRHQCQGVKQQHEQRGGPAAAQLLLLNAHALTQRWHHGNTSKGWAVERSGG